MPQLDYEYLSPSINLFWLAKMNFDISVCIVIKIENDYGHPFIEI